jgi:hypothetical protein
MKRIAVLIPCPNGELTIARVDHRAHTRPFPLFVLLEAAGFRKRGK